MSIHHLAKSHLPESKGSKGSVIVYRTRLLLRTLSLCLSFALVIILGHAIAVYNSTKKDEINGEPIWPTGLKMKPTILLLSAASVATALSLAICLASFSEVVWSPFSLLLSSSLPL